MLRLLKASLFVVAIFWATHILAAPADIVSVNFTAPTVGADQEAISHFVLNENCDTTPTTLIDPVVDGGSYPGALQTGNVYSLCVTAVDVSGRVGPISNIQTADLRDILPPGAPTNFSIQIQCADCMVTITPGP